MQVNNQRLALFLAVWIACVLGFSDSPTGCSGPDGEGMTYENGPACELFRNDSLVGLSFFEIELKAQPGVGSIVRLQIVSEYCAVGEIPSSQQRCSEDEQAGALSGALLTPEELVVFKEQIAQHDASTPYNFEDLEISGSPPVIGFANFSEYFRVYDTHILVVLSNNVGGVVDVTTEVEFFTPDESCLSSIAAGVTIIVIVTISVCVCCFCKRCCRCCCGKSKEDQSPSFITRNINAEKCAPNGCYLRMREKCCPCFGLNKWEDHNPICMGCLPNFLRKRYLSQPTVSMWYWPLQQDDLFFVWFPSRTEVLSRNWRIIVAIVMVSSNAIINLYWANIIGSVTDSVVQGTQAPLPNLTSFLTKAAAVAAVTFVLSKGFRALVRFVHRMATSSFQACCGKLWLYVVILALFVLVAVLVVLGSINLLDSYRCGTLIADVIVPFVFVQFLQDIVLGIADYNFRSLFGSDYEARLEKDGTNNVELSV